MTEPAYLGDGVYIQADEGGLILTTGTHILAHADNVIYMEPGVLIALQQYLEKVIDGYVECEDIRR